MFFWTGIHERELLALTIEDFTYNDVDEYRLNIDKNFEVVKGIQYLLTPKTDSSRRCLPYRSFYTTRPWTIITPYMSRIQRRACFTKNFLIKDIKRVAKLAGLEPIRVHDIRHPYVKATTKIFLITRTQNNTDLF